MAHKVRYAPPVSDIVGGIVFLLVSIGMFIVAVSLELISGKMERQDVIFIGVVVLIGVLGLIKLYKSYAQPRNKEIVLKPDMIIIPRADDIKTDEVLFEDIQSVEKSYDGLFLKILTEEQEYKLDLSWISDKKALDSLVQELKKLIA